jgi:hypothetical protein
MLKRYRRILAFAFLSLLLAGCVRAGPTEEVVPTPTPTAPATHTFTGRLIWSEIEGRHMELKCEEKRYVLLPASDEVRSALLAHAGKTVTIRGTLSGGPSIYMRPLIEVYEFLGESEMPHSCGEGR